MKLQCSEVVFTHSEVFADAKDVVIISITSPTGETSLIFINFTIEDNFTCLQGKLSKKEAVIPLLCI